MAPGSPPSLTNLLSLQLLELCHNTLATGALQLCSFLLERVHLSRQLLCQQFLNFQPILQTIVLLQVLVQVCFQTLVFLRGRNVRRKLVQ